MPKQTNAVGRAGWDDHSLFDQRVRNYTKKPIEVEIRRTFPGHVVFRSSLGAKNHDYQTVEYTATVKPSQKACLLYDCWRSARRQVLPGCKIEH